MADSLKTAGLTLTLDGGVEFERSIKAINAELKVGYQELRLLREQYKITGAGTESLTKQNEILGNQYEIQSEKVRNLKRRLEEATDQYGIQSEEVNRVKASLTQAETRLESLKNQIYTTTLELEKSTNGFYQFGTKLEDAGGKIEKVGKKMTDVGKTMSVAITAPLTAAAAFSVTAAKDFESAMTGVAKTTDLTADELAAMGDEFIDLSTKIPSTAVELANVAEMAGQLGIKNENIVGFTKVITDLSNSTNVLGEEGAASMAKYANITGMAQTDFDRFGSSIVALGNNFATTERDILNMSTRLASAGKQAGMTDSEILGLATALSSLGLEAEGGGSSFAKMINRLQIATETGNKELEGFASVAGMTSKEFQKAFKDDATGALEAFIVGLGDTSRHGKSTSVILDELGITELRLSDALKRTAGSSDLVSKAVSLSNDAWAENVALTNEASMRYETSASKLEIQKNKLTAVGITIGNELLPHVVSLAENVANLATKFNELDPEVQKTILSTLAIVAAAGPVLSIGGKITEGVGKLTSGIGGLLKKLGEKQAVTAATEAISGLGTAAGTATTASGSLASGIGGVSSALIGPMGAVALFGALTAAIVLMVRESDEVGRALREIEKSVDSIRQSTINQTTASEANAAMAYELGTSLETLAKKESLTNDERLESKILIEKLNALYPELNLAIDEQSGKVANLATDWRTMIDEQMKLAIVNIYQEQNTKLLEENAKAYMMEYEAIKNADEVAEKHGITRDQLSEKVMEYGQAVIEAGTATSEEYEELAKANNELNATRETREKTTAAYTESVEEMMAVTDSLIGSNAELTDSNESVARSSTETADTIMSDADRAATATEEYRERLAEAQQAAVDAYAQAKEDMTTLAREKVSEMGTIEDEGISQSSITAAKVKENLEKQVEDYRSWHANIKELASKVPTDVMSELEALGPKYAPLMAELNGMTDSELEDFVTTWRTKSELAVDVAAEEWQAAPDDVKEVLDSVSTAIENNTTVSEKARQLALDALNEVKATYPDVFAAGQNYGKELTKGIEGEHGAIIDTSKKAVTDATYQSRLSTSGASQIGSELINGATSAVTNNAYKLANAGSSAVVGALKSMRMTAQISSPSKATYQIGDYMVEGLEDSLLDGADQIGAAARKLTKEGLDEMGGSVDYSVGASLPGMVQSFVPSTTLITIQSMSVRSDQDIELIANELDRLSTQKARGAGYDF